MPYPVVPDIPSAVITSSQIISDAVVGARKLAVNADGSINETAVAVNVDAVPLLTSGPITLDGNSTDQTNLSYKGINVFIVPGAFTPNEAAMVVTLEGKDPVSATYYTILASAALSASTPVTLTVYPGIAVSANVSANAVLPTHWRVKYAAANWGDAPGSVLGISCGLLR